ncbi:hypothetical protein GOB93_04605 [Acetobacter musti]|uniref:Uncharacterized protein n=1 Tax=Acetobacter musti TaxID=864732 RepID=A0ABX0JMF8_9PROT|nr:hypothetical protein [Acetobacter musti]NHN83923.1 hypothetical protein [Acetobacter musti]
MPFFVGFMGLVIDGPADIASEASGDGYVRQPVSFTSPGDGRLTRAISSSYSFGLATEDWGLVTGIRIYSSLIADASPVASWGVRPKMIAAGQTYTVPVEALSLLIETREVFAADDILGLTADGAEVIAGQTLSIVDGVLMLASASGGGDGSGALTLAQLNVMMSQLLQSLPQDDPGDGTSLWLNSDLLALSQKG